MSGRRLFLVAVATAIVGLASCDDGMAFREGSAKMHLDADGDAALDMLAECLPVTPSLAIDFETWQGTDPRPLRVTLSGDFVDLVHKCLRDEMWKRGAVVVP